MGRPKKVSEEIKQPDQPDQQYQPDYSNLSGEIKIVVIADTKYLKKGTEYTVPANTAKILLDKGVVSLF